MVHFIDGSWCGHIMGLLYLAARCFGKESIPLVVIAVGLFATSAYAESPRPSGLATMTALDNSPMYKTGSPYLSAPNYSVAWNGVTYTMSGSYSSDIQDDVAVFVTRTGVTSSPSAFTYSTTVVSVNYEGDGWYKITFAGFVNGVAYAYPTIGSGGNNLVSYSFLLRANPTFDMSSSNKSFMDPASGTVPATTLSWLYVLVPPGSGGGSSGGGGDTSGPVVEALQSGLSPNPSQIRMNGLDKPAGVIEPDGEVVGDPGEADGIGDTLTNALKEKFGIETAIATPSGTGASRVEATLTIPLNRLIGSDFKYNVGGVPGEGTYQGTAPGMHSAWVTKLNTIRPYIRAFLLFLMYFSLAVLVLEAIRQ